jgi:RNA polymerase sigma-70 factor, ECF subfamily
VRAAAVAPNVFPIAKDDGGSDELIARLSAGDDDALREAYRQHHEGVRVFANRLVNDVGAAEDLVHEVFVALPRAVRRFRKEVPLRQFLIAMAVNHARHHLRAAVRRRRAQHRLAHQPRPTVVTPERIAETRQLSRALVAALDGLPLDQRIAFVLCEVEERSSSEAARIAGTSDGNMRARLHHARRALRQRLAPWRQEGELT